MEIRAITDRTVFDLLFLNLITSRSKKINYLVALQFEDLLTNIKFQSFQFATTHIPHSHTTLYNFSSESLHYVNCIFYYITLFLAFLHLIMIIFPIVIIGNYRSYWEQQNKFLWIRSTYLDSIFRFGYIYIYINFRLHTFTFSRLK